MNVPSVWLPLNRTDALLTITLVSIGVGILGCLTGQPYLIGAGAAGICMICRNVEQLADIGRQSQLHKLAATLLKKCGQYELDGSHRIDLRTMLPEESESPSGPSLPVVQRAEDAAEANELVENLLSTGRYALLLRKETIGHLDRDQYARVIHKLDERMALVPAGAVLTGMDAERATLNQELGTTGQLSGDSTAKSVEACYLDRYAVTNADYQQFVSSDGYEHLEYWPEESLAALFDFVDASGEPGPRYWQQGHYLPGEGDLPITGISWYEATAYARWVGKRLPTDAEWTKACAWPIEGAPGRINQRRYPWGESYDSRRANLWSSGKRTIVPVRDYQAGVTVGGVEQMIGNVWEWTASSLDQSTPENVSFPESLRCIRGGAYNTYFENQATCHYQSGEHPLARRPNIGLRLVLSMSSLASFVSRCAPAVPTDIDVTELDDDPIMSAESASLNPADDSDV